MRALVTGGAGFLGSHLCDRLWELGWHITALDDLSTGRLDNLSQLRGRHRFRLLRADVRHEIPGDYDAVFNLACPASPDVYQRDPVRTLLVCVVGAQRCLELAQRCGAVLVQASTSEVYGDPEVHPQHEAYAGRVNPSSIRSCYDEGKRAAETLCADFGRSHGVDARVVRIFNTYGPRMSASDGRVVSNFVSQALLGQPLSLYGAGSATRCFCYVEDMVTGLLSAGTAHNFRGPVNLGSDREISVSHLANVIAALVEHDPGRTHHPAPEDDPTRRRPDLSLARRTLSWAPKVGLEQGLANTINWMRLNVEPMSKHAVP